MPSSWTTTLCLAGVAVLLALPAPAEESKPGIESLAFMAGCWEGDLDEGTRIRETYTTPRGGAMLGNSQIIAGDSTPFFELIRITQDADGVHYRPYPGGKESVAFSLVRISPTEAVFENPEHDYPQRIVYDGGVEGELSARVEKIDGTRVQKFSMRATACGGERHQRALAETQRMPRRVPEADFARKTGA